MFNVTKTQQHPLLFLMASVAILLTCLMVTKGAGAQSIQRTSPQQVMESKNDRLSGQAVFDSDHIVFLPTLLQNWSPPPPPSPPPAADIPCLYTLNWWRNPNPPFNIIRSTFSPDCLVATEVEVNNIFDDVGRQTAYQASVTRQDQPNFEMEVEYLFNSGGGVIGADVTKIYPGGYVYQLEITQFCPTIGNLVGYKVIYEGNELSFGNCPS